MKRGAINTAQAEFIGLWIPKEMVRMIDRGVKNEDSDRSKFVRAAIREKLKRPEPVAK